MVFNLALGRVIFQELQLTEFNVGIGSTAPVGKLNVSGRSNWEGPRFLNETGDQAILTASAS